MEYKTLDTSLQDGVAICKMNRENTLNSLTVDLMQELGDFFKNIAGNHEIKVVVLTGGENCFSSGLDMEMAIGLSKLTSDEKMELIDLAQEAFVNITKCPLPTIAAVSGPALAAGFDLMSLCDIRIFSKTAMVGQPEIHWALTQFSDPMWKLVGIGRAKELILSGRLYGADEAYQIGLANYVYEVAEFMPAVLKYAKRMARSDRRALMASKEQANRVPGLEPEAAVRTQIWAFRNFVGSDEMTRRMNAFLDKRKG